MRFANARSIIDYDRHYDSEVCALLYLGEYLEWLKSEEIL
ncbi:Hypothetical protein BN2458_PEG0664 [Helicobacter typhlonius]|uniref:Uncharacterized protein n=1 Tax=Helicobacter typhlonius TaxID=76936 RepID=A0A0S4PWG1_9HELI|nr:Hypothetical protein BN2458_PEG0664 [Helicobacter typhlonius]